MSYYISRAELSKDQILDITQKVCVEKIANGKHGHNTTMILHHSLQINGSSHILLPLGVKAMLTPKGINPPEMIYNNKNRPNADIEHTLIPGSINDSFSLRGEQPQVVKDALEKLDLYSTALLELSCNYGKTCMSVYLGQKLKYKWLFITPRTVLKQQTLRDSLKVTMEKVQILTSKVVIDPNASGYIISSHIVKNFEYNDLADIGTVILDEVHMLFTPGFLPNLLKFCPKYLIALSATPDRKDGLDKAIPLYIDSRSYVKAFIEMPISLYKIETALKLKIMFNKMKEVDWTAMIEQSSNCSWRNWIIASLAYYYRKYKPLILCNRKDQVREIYNYLVQMDTKVDTFMETDTQFNPESEILVAIMTKIGVGFDGVFNCCILASDVTDIRQMVGRIGRHFDFSDGDLPIVIDMVDNFSSMQKHYNMRLEQYKKFNGLNPHKIVYWRATSDFLFRYN